MLEAYLDSPIDAFLGSAVSSGAHVVCRERPTRKSAGAEVGTRI